jgi:hypothetical protein
MLFLPSQWLSEVDLPHIVRVHNLMPVQNRFYLNTELMVRSSEKKCTALLATQQGMSLLKEIITTS